MLCLIKKNLLKRCAQNRLGDVGVKKGIRDWLRQKITKEKKGERE